MTLMLFRMSPSEVCPVLSHSQTRSRQRQSLGMGFVGFLLVWLYREFKLFSEEVLETWAPISRLGIDLPGVLIYKDRMHFI